jgi:hypothetical protein
MKQITKLIGMLALGGFALGQADVALGADANPPERMTYQGYLVDGNGAPLGNSAPTNYDVVFRVYADKQVGTALWAEQQTITVDKGYFSVLLGEGSSTASGEPRGNLSAAFDGLDASDRFIGITVETGSGATEIAPRLRLVASPYAYTATQARRLTDGSGNANFYKDGTTLKLGVGSTPTLTLTEAGNATLTGKLTADMPDWGVGLQVDNGAVSTTFGAESSSVFHFNTELPGFYFNKKLVVNGDIRSYQRDSILGSDNNTDTYLRVKSASDVIDANADEFWVRGDSNYLQTKFTSNKVELHTDAGSVYLNKPLTVNGTLTAYDLSLSGWIGRTAHNNGGLVGSYNNVGSNGTKTNPIYVIGSGYKPAESTLSNMYGVGYTEGSASFITGGGSGWGFYVAADGDARTFLAGSGGYVSYINKDGGKVGIGTDSPVQALDVNGHIKIRGGAIVGSGDHYCVIEDYGSQIGVTIRNQMNNEGSIGTSAIRWDDGFITELWASVQGSDRRIKKDITPVQKNELLEMIDEMSFYQYRLRFSREEKMKRQGRDASGFFYGIMAQELREIYPNVVKSSGLAVELDENEEDEEKIQENHWYVEKDRLAELALGGVKDLYAISKEKEAALDSLINRNQALEIEVETLKSEMAVLKARLANSTTQEDRIAKLEELVSKIGQGE